MYDLNTINAYEFTATEFKQKVEFYLDEKDFGAMLIKRAVSLCLFSIVFVTVKQSWFDE